MDFVTAVKSVLTNYAGFSGRAARAEYWYYALFVFVAMLVLSFVDYAMGTVNEDGYGLLNGVFALATLCPSLAVGFRRMHDIGKSAWWLLIGLIPFVGFLILIYFFVQPSQPGPNQYGPHPYGM